MIIEKILKLKNNKYKIILDSEEIITYDNVILENNLLFKKNINKELYKKIIKDTKYYSVYNTCVRSILKRRKSKKEMLLYLDKFDIEESDKDSIIKKLEDMNLINDKEFARAYINDKIYLNKSGVNKIRNDLLNLDIDSSIIEEELSYVDSNLISDNLEKLILKKIRSNHKYSNFELKNKILKEMTNLGYNKDDIINIIDNNIKSDDDIIEKEFNRIYNKLKTKYSGIELTLKLKQKMLSKGFEMDRVNELIKKTED